MSRHGSHFVYIIAPVVDGKYSRPVKVGHAKNPYARLGSIQTGSHQTLEVAATFEFPSKRVACDVERSFHDVLADKRVRGEWFDMDTLSAMRSICTCVRVGLVMSTKLDEQERRHMRDLSGVTRAEEILREYGYSVHEWDGDDE